MIIANSSATIPMHIDSGEPRSARDAEQVELALAIERIIRTWIESGQASPPEHSPRMTFEPAD